TFSKVQVIDLDAAMESGSNIALVREIASRLPCRVGGGIRSVERAQDVLDAGAQQIIAGSALFKDGRPNLEFARRLADAVGAERVRSEEHTSELQSRFDLVCRLLLEKKKKKLTL